jgi:hypothetical protein
MAAEPWPVKFAWNSLSAAQLSIEPLQALSAAGKKRCLIFVESNLRPGKAIKLKLIDSQ